MARDNLALRVDEHRDVEAEGLDAASDLTNLARAVRAWVSRVELELSNRQVTYLDSVALKVGGARVLKYP
jgi:hypothetical protein